SGSEGRLIRIGTLSSSGSLRSCKTWKKSSEISRREFKPSNQSHARKSMWPPASKRNDGGEYGTRASRAGHLKRKHADCWRWVGDCVPAFHGFSERGEERQLAAGIEPAVSSTHFLRGRGSSLSRLRRERNRFLREVCFDGNVVGVAREYRSGRASLVHAGTSSLCQHL